MTKTDEVDLAATAEQIKKELGKSLDERVSELVARLTKQFEDGIAKAKAEFEAKQASFSLPGSEDAKHKGRKYSLARAYAGVMTGDYSVCELEREMHDNLKKKAMSFGTDTAGGFLVPNEVVQSEIIPLLYASSVCMQAGATQLNNLTRAPIQVPRVSGGTTAYWLGEGSTITSSDATLGQLSMTPKGLAALTVVSDLLLQVESPGVESMLRGDMARQLGLKLDLGALAGSGASGQPTGIINASGVNTTTISDPATYNQLVAAISAVRGSDALMGNLAWVMSNADMLEIEQMVDTDSGGTNTRSQTFERRRLLSEDGSSLLGYKAFVSTQLSDGQIIFGNFADLVLAQWGGLRIEMTNALGFATAQSHIRALTYVDIGLRHAASFCIPA